MIFSKQRILFFLGLILIIFYSSCRKDFGTVLSSGTLSFSKDTIYLDTIFTNISSSTRHFKVYNKSSRAITIPSISLENGLNSYYRLNVDGIPGKHFENIDILAHDSIFIFVEATIDFNTVSNPLYTDKILFDNGTNKQNVNLVTLVQDAHFLYPAKDSNGIIGTIKLGTDTNGDDIKVNGYYLNGNTTFVNDKPYVIYGYLGIPDNATLNIDKGVKLYFHEDSGIMVDKGGTLNVNGSLYEKVIFQGDRLENSFKNTAGQWGTIWLRAGSKDNSINNAIIKNSIIGILSDSIGSNTTAATLQIKNTEIYNTSNYGILGRSTYIEGQNIVIANNGQASLACTIGGDYKFTHCTFANYFKDGFRQFPTLLINNYISYTDNGVEKVLAYDLSQAQFTNCIIDGNQNIEMILDKNDGSSFNYQFNNNLIKFNDINNNFVDNPLYNFTNQSIFNNNLLNVDAKFKDVNTNQLIIGKDSEIINKADAAAAAQIPFDVLGVNRLPNPDIGAYQHSEEF